MDTIGFQKKFNGFDVFNYIFLIFLSVIMLYPIWETIVVSIMNAEEATSLGFKFYTLRPTIEAYKSVFTSKLIGIGYINTILRTAIGTLLTVFFSFCTAYPLSKKQLPARNALTVFYLIPMFFGGGLIPNFLLIKGIGLFDTLWALILPGMLSTYNILIMRNFISSLPDSLEESAILDGASFLRILLRIVMPLSMPILATIALWETVRHWNSWFDAMIYTRDDKKMVLQLILRRILIEKDSTSMDDITGMSNVVSKSVEAATVMVSIAPILMMYPFLQKYFVKGIMIGSLKG